MFYASDLVHNHVTLSLGVDRSHLLMDVFCNTLSGLQIHNF